MNYNDGIIDNDINDIKLFKEINIVCNAIRLKNKLGIELKMIIQVLKMYAWERTFMKKVSDIRGEELKCVRNLAWLTAAIRITWFATPFLVLK